MVTTSSVPFHGIEREFQDLREPMLAAVESALASGRALQSPLVERLESELARRADRRHAVAVNSCTDALYFALLAVGVGRGDEVLVPDLSFAATASSVLRTGATAIFVDVDGELGLDLHLAEQALTEATKAIVYVHLFGRLSKPVVVEAFARRHELILVEDAAQSFGAEDGSRPAGSLGHVSCYSFDPTKVVSAPAGGGAVLTDDDECAATVRALRYHGRVGGEYERLGFNSQLSTLAAAALLVKLAQEERWLRRRRAIARTYCEALGGCGVQLPAAGHERQHVFHKFVVRTSERDTLAAELGAHGVPTLVHYPYRLSALPFVQGLPHRTVGGGKAAAATGELLSLPIHPYLRADEVERVGRAAASFRAHVERKRGPACRTEARSR